MPPAYRLGRGPRAALLSSKSAAEIALDVNFFVAAAIALLFDLLLLGETDAAISLTSPDGPMPEGLAHQRGGVGPMFYKVALADSPEANGLAWDDFLQWLLQNDLA